MTVRASIMKIVQQDDLNFLLTNALPRRQATRLMGWFSKIEHPWICAASLRVWGFFSDLDLSEAKTARFPSMHACFTRQLKDGARPVAMDDAILASPCDAIVGAAGRIVDGQVLQVKGLPYALGDLLGDEVYAETFKDGCYVTLRLTSSMYHRFHAPAGCMVHAVTHIFGDVWNVNPATLRRVARLFCRNERAVIRTTLAGTGQPLALVAVAAILVAGIRLNFLDMPVGSARKIRRTYGCAVPVQKGEEMGWFEHGSTILVFAPAGFSLCGTVTEGMTIRMGQALLRCPSAGAEPG